jgi:hypothetical protein
VGDFLQIPHTWSDGEDVSAAGFNEHVNEAIFKPTSISGRTLKDPAALSDELIIADAGVLKKVTLQQLYALLIQPGAIVQYAYQEYRTWNGFDILIPEDDTVPQNTEGTEIISLAITPRFSSSIIRAHFHAPYVYSFQKVSGIAAIFVDSTANAIGAQVTWGDLNIADQFDFDVTTHYAPGSTSSVTFKVRVGPGAPASAIYLNGLNTGRYMGGSQAASFTLEEIKQ